MNNIVSTILTSLFNGADDAEVKEYDLTTKEGHQEFKKQVEELKQNETFKSLLNIFDVDSDDLLNTMDELADSIYEDCKDEDVKDSDNSIKEEHFVRPSELLDYDHQMQLHKITQQYIDEMIKPYNNGKLTDEQINDAYAGLYEFAAWIMNK